MMVRMGESAGDSGSDRRVADERWGGAHSN